MGINGALGQQISFSTRTTQILGTSGFFRGETSQSGKPIVDANIFAIRFGMIKKENKYLERLYNGPEFGIGIEFLDIHNDSEIGDPFSGYMFMEAGLINNPKFRLTLATDFGISMGWKPYNAFTNPKNLALGSRTNYHIGMGLRSYMKIYKNWSILLATTLNHHSNGAVTKPNLGINMVSAEVGVKLSIGKSEENSITTIEEINYSYNNSRSRLSLFSGIRNLEKDGPYYTFYGLQINKTWPLSKKLSLGIGVESLYDLGVFTERDNTSFAEKYSNALYVISAISINRIEFGLEIGHYVWRNKGDRLPDTHIFQRLGISYKIYNDLFIGLKVRAFELRKADLLELHVGYQL